MRSYRLQVPGYRFKSLLFRLCLLPIAYCLLFTISSCETPEKVLKSTDLNYKKNKAIYWYNKKEYFKCIPVFEELIGLMKGRESTEELYYMYAMANYKQGDYMISAYHFKNFYDLYPNGTYSEECLYMQGKSFQMLSPKPDLDQTYTYKGLEAYQFYINMYPGGKFQYESNEAITRLRKKLEKKALNAAELYYKTSNYKAAATSYEIILTDYPDIEESEKVSFMIVKARFKYAENSIAFRKAERYNNVVKSYNDFKYKFATSKYLEEAKKYEQASHYLAVEGAFEWAETAAPIEREKYFGIAFNEAKVQLPFIIEQREKDNINKWIEKGYFTIVKNNYQISEEKKSVEKLPSLLQTVKTYYTFVDQFPKSRYAKEAERIYNNSNAQIKKLKTNG